MRTLKQELIMPKGLRFLVVEDNCQRVAWFIDRLGEDIHVAQTPADALRRLEDGAPYDVIFLDHDAGNTLNVLEDFSGVAKRLAELNFLGQVFIHSMNYSGAKRMQHTMRGGTILPFGTFELRVQ